MLDFQDIWKGWFPFPINDDLFLEFIESTKSTMIDQEFKRWCLVLFFQDFYHLFMSEELDRIEMICDIELIKSHCDFMNFIEECITI